MQITQGTDYAVRIVDVLARSQQRMDAASVSEQAQVPSRFCLKILRSLVHSGIVTSYKGAKGGYTLARPAGMITLLEVIEAVEGPYRISRCQDSQYQCCHTSCGFIRFTPKSPILSERNWRPIHFRRTSIRNRKNKRNSRPAPFLWCGRFFREKRSGLPCWNEWRTFSHAESTGMRNTCCKRWKAVKKGTGVWPRWYLAIP